MTDLEILDEALNFLNTGNMTLDHKNNMINTYEKLSHKPIKKDQTGFYLFHNELAKKAQSILKEFKLKGKLFGVYPVKNALEETRVATILIDKSNMKKEDYEAAVVKLMNTYKGNQLTPIFNALNNKVEVTDANYCYTVTYQVYSIDITYTKK